MYNILDHQTEADQILYEDPSPTEGYIVLPDLKWDRKTLSALYLVAIVHSRSLRSLRDLRREHLGMLRSIEGETYRIAQKTWGIPKGGLRFYLHYQPSYCESRTPFHLDGSISRSLLKDQLHVHIVTVEYVGFAGMNVGQAHLYVHDGQLTRFRHYS